MQVNLGISSHSLKPDLNAEELIALRARLDEITATADSAGDIADLMMRIDDANDDYPVVQLVLPAGQVFFRAVRHSNKPANTSELHRPPEKIRPSLQRANIEGERHFYGALYSSYIPLMECGCRPGDTFVIGHWLTMRPMRLSTFGYSMEFLERYPEPKPDWLKPATTRHRDELIRKWQCEMFNAPGSVPVYLVTNAMFRMSAHPASGGCDGIMYPSVAMGEVGNNVALLPEPSIRGLQFIKAHWVRVESVLEKKDRHPAKAPCELTVLDECRTFKGDGTLVWSGCKPYRAVPTLYK